MTVALILHCDGAAQPGDYDATFRCSEVFGLGDREDARHYLIENARRSGWKVGPKGDAMCSSCGAPDKKTLRLIEALGMRPRRSGELDRKADEE